MKALIWKEWRETLPVSLIGFLLLTASAAITLFKLSTANDSLPYDGSHLDWLLFGAPCVALAIAAVQGLAERERDLYAFLIHRPISRGRIVAAKLLVGSIAYLLSAGLAYAASAWWASVPGHIAAPFDIHFGEAAIADIFGGAMFYFGGLLTAGSSTRPAVRILAIPAALAIEILVTIVPEFRQALALVIPALVLAATAAYGRFRTDGVYEDQHAIERFATVMVVLIGLGLPSWLTITMSVKALASRSYLSSSNKPWTYSGYELTGTGEFLIVHQSTGSRPTYTTLQGGTLSAAAAKRARQPDTQDGQTWPFAYGEGYEAEFPKAPDTYQSSSRWYTRIPDFPGYVYWYWDKANRIFIGYDLKKKRPAEMLTADGFRDPSAPGPRKPFEAKPIIAGFNGLIDFQRPDGIYAVDFGYGRNMLRLLACGPGGFRTVYSVVPRQGDITMSPVIVVDTPARTWFLSPWSRLFSIPCTAPRGTILQNAQFIRSRSKYVLEFGADEHESFFNQGAPIPSFIVDVSKSGRVLRTYYLPDLPSIEYPAVAWKSPSSVIRTQGALSPPLFIAIAGNHLVPIDERFNGTLTNWMDRVYGSLWSFGEYETATHVDRHFVVVALRSSVACGIVCAVAVWWLGARRRLAIASRITWLVPPLALGPVGAVLMVVMTRAEATVLCPSCGKPRRPAQLRCRHCGAAFPQPAATDTNIFESIEQRLEVTR